MDLPQYFSDTECVDEEMNTNLKTKIRRKRKWNMVTVFKTKYECDEAIKQENLWSFHYVNNTIEGRKVYYRCNKVKLRGNQCDAGLYLFYDAASDDIIMFKCDAEHTHNSVELHNSRISLHVQQEIRKLLDFKLKPKGIMEALYDNKFEVPSMVQLRNFLTKIKKEKYGSETITLGKLEQWCFESCQTTLDIDTPFVVSYEVMYPDEFNDEEDFDGHAGSIFRIFISTRRLLTTSSTSTKIHADATYKLVWQGFPILIVGTTDADRHFHPFGLAICTNEEKQDFKFLFQSLVNGVEKICQKKSCLKY